MAIDIPRIEVTAGGFTAARYGLFSVASVVPMPTAEGQQRQDGVQYMPTACGPASLTRDGCVEGVDLNPGAKEFERTGWIGSVPFTVYAGVACSPVGQTWVEARARATDALLNGEQWAAERAYAAGSASVGARPSLQDAAAQIIAAGVVVQPQSVAVTGGGAGLVASLAELEQALANCYAGEGVIHVQRRVVPYLSSKGLVRVDGDVLRTYNGNKVLVASGMAGGSATATTIYGTGPVQVWRSEVWYPGGDEEGASIDRGNNTRAVLAERTYNVAFECCLLARAVTLEEAS